MTRVAFLWHMHQPYYEDLVTREHILPWVRLHALKDYYGMVALLEEFPRVRATFNLVPSLLIQLEAFAEERAHDRYLEVGLTPAAALSPDDIVFMLKNFFHAQRTRMIDIYPRYAELLAKRGGGVSAPEIEAAVRRFTTADLRDLQVWQKLTWMDPYFLEGDARGRALVAKGQGYSEEDKLVLRAAELELLNAVIPAYRRRVEAGQIEIATSPFYHPILPLLCDTDVYKHTHPHSRMPRHRFQHPDDAREQLERAAAYHERLFGRRPVGLWPSEGSVSDAMVPLAAGAGFTWMATDELILARTLGISFTRDAHGYVHQADRLYRPYDVSAGGHRIACGFRDHSLSDMIGFNYSGWDPDRAADDFVARLDESGRRAGESGGEVPVIFVILDGENAWEYFEGGGRPFLRALYGRLSDHPSLETVTMSEACRHQRHVLDGISPGSWIDANFYIWIGHQDDQRGWSQLAEARDALNAPGTNDATALARAMEEILIAEGSDWFWWYGDDHSSDHDREFDDLFRRHLRNVYGLLNKPVPNELFATNITVGTAVSSQVDPIRLIAPVVDGEDSSYFEWLGAGVVEVRDVAGAMHQTDRRGPVITAIRFGFDQARLYVRFDTARRAAELLAQGQLFGLTFLEPEGVRVQVSLKGSQVAVTMSGREPGAESWREHSTGAVVGAGSILEVAIPFSELGSQPAVSFFVTVSDGSGSELERHPSGRPVEVAVPGAGFEALNWSA